MACSFERQRTTAYGTDLRWRIVYQRAILKLTQREIARNVNVDVVTVCRILKLFNSTGDVTPGRRTGRPTCLAAIEELVIIENVLVNPSVYLHEGLELISEALQVQKLVRVQFAGFSIEMGFQDRNYVP